MTDTTTFFLSLAGFAALLLAMPRHQAEWLGRKPSVAVGRAIRFAGFLGLALAFIVAGTAFGRGYGAVAWFGWMTVAAALIVTLHTIREQIMRKDRR